MTEQATPTLAELAPQMAATVLPIGSLQADMMRFGKLPPKAKQTADDISQPLVISTAIYDGLAMLYNEAEVGAMLILSLPNRPTMGNLHRVLKGRGLQLGADYQAYRARFDVDGNRFAVKDRPLVVERLSETTMKISHARPDLGRVLAEVARQRQVATEQLTHARSEPLQSRLKQQEAERRLRLLQQGTSAGVDDLLNSAAQPAPLALSGSLDEQEGKALEALVIPPPPPRTGA